MNRSPRLLRWIAPGLLLMVIAAVVAVLPSTAADAQENTNASLTLAVSPADAAQPFRTLGVALESGDSGLAALGATIRFDANVIVAGSCSVSEVGACNVTDDGRVLVSVFNLSGLKSNDQLLTVSFEPAPDATGIATFDLTVDTAVSAQGTQLPTIAGASTEVELAPVEYGSLTGDVIDGESTAGLFALDVCVTHDLTQASTCTTSSGLGTWRIDDLPAGGYTITVSDPAGGYAPAATLSTVTADVVTAGIETAMTLASDEVADDETAADEQQDVAPPVPVVPQEPEPVVIVYEASIAGRVTALDTAAPIEALQICATQPLVLHQSCATTDADGVFALADLSTGNYWVTIVDPLGQFAEARSKLVGVVGDDVAREGVQIRLVRIAE